MNPAEISVRCADRHLPSDYPEKLLARVGRLRDLVAHLRGIIDTPEKYGQWRLAMARAVWDRLNANDSAACRSCHARADLVAPDLPAAARPDGPGQALACDGCQKEAAAVLTQSCTRVPGLSLSGCLGCQDPGARVSDGPDPYFSALHARHIGRVDCTGCHRWSADGGFAVLGDDGGGGPFRRPSGSASGRAPWPGRPSGICRACTAGSTSAAPPATWTVSPPGGDRSLLNARCQSCRGSLEELAQTAQRIDSSHRSHLLDIECTDCHAGHCPLEVYCHLCHSFDRPPFDLAGGRPSAGGPRS